MTDWGKRQRLKRMRRKRQLRIRFLIFSLLAISVITVGHFVNSGTDYDQLTPVYLKENSKENSKAPKKNIFSISKRTKNPDWNLVLVNKWNPVDEKEVDSIDLVQLRNGQSVDRRCYPFLQEMMDDCRAAGFKPIISSSFRTKQRQQEIFDQQIKIYENAGMDREAAREKTAKSVAVPGTSEHQLGLAVDITDVDQQMIVSGMEAQPVQRWLRDNCWKYGFILRYPQDKSEITGIVYEPWHFRYVGTEAAKYIYDHEITLEEYIKQL